MKEETNNVESSGCCAVPSFYPTISDISAFMRELGYGWSNEAQVYYDYNFEHISDKSARRLYRYLVGDNPFVKPLREDKISHL